MSIFYVDGHFVPENEAVINVRDLAVLRGYGAFDYLRTYGKQPFRMAKNLERLRRTCDILEIEYPWTDDEIAHIVTETLERNVALGDSEEYSIRLVITGGMSSNNITPEGDTRLIVLVQPFTPMPAELYTDGAKIITVDLNRLFPDAKSTLYTPAILAQKRAKERGGVEALYTDRHGNILECTTSNVFAFIDDTLVTPPTADHILPGITRMTALEVASEHFDVVIRNMTLDELLSADEVFITSANKEILPIVTIDEDTIADGTVGERTQKMISAWRELTQKRATGVTV
ncbi:MAG: aminotransferase class IV [Chloroflexota bacterium]